MITFDASDNRLCDRDSRDHDSPGCLDLQATAHGSQIDLSSAFIVLLSRIQQSLKSDIRAAPHDVFI